MSFYPEHIPPQRKPLQTLVGAELDAAWNQYQWARQNAWVKEPISAVWHIFWLFVTLAFFPIGIPGWIIHASKGTMKLRPGVQAPVWPPPGSYVPTGAPFQVGNSRGMQAPPGYQ